MLPIFLEQYNARFGPTWTLDPAVKPFGSTVRKEAGRVVETSEEKRGVPKGVLDFVPCVFKPLGTTGPAVLQAKWKICYYLATVKL